MTDLSVLEVPGHDDGISYLDPVTVFWENWKLGQGRVTLVAYDGVWSCGFWAMGERTIQTFFYDASVDYLVNKLGISPFLKYTKQHKTYLGRVILSIKKEIKGLKTT